MKKPVNNASKEKLSKEDALNLVRLEFARAYFAHTNSEHFGAMYTTRDEVLTDYAFVSKRGFVKTIEHQLFSVNRSLDDLSKYAYIFKTQETLCNNAVLRLLIPADGYDIIWCIGEGVDGIEKDIVPSDQILPDHGRRVRIADLCLGDEEQPIDGFCERISENPYYWIRFHDAELDPDHFCRYPSEEIIMNNMICYTQYIPSDNVLEYQEFISEMFLYDSKLRRFTYYYNIKYAVFNAPIYRFTSSAYNEVEDSGDASDKNTRLADSGHRTAYESGAVRETDCGKGRCDLVPEIMWHTLINSIRQDKDDKISDFIVDAIEDILGFLNTKNVSLLDTALKSLCLAVAAKDNGNDKLGLGEDYGKIVAYTIIDVSKQFEDGAKKYGERNWERGLPFHCYVDSALRHSLKEIMGMMDEPHLRAATWNVICLIQTIRSTNNWDDGYEFPIMLES